MHGDPIAFFLTWSTYGTWLPGDSRGWMEYKNGWQFPQPDLEAAAKSVMNEIQCVLNKEQRRAVELQMAETCQQRGWHLCAVNCRSNHIHAAVAAVDTKPKKIRVDLKAWATRCLKEQFDFNRKNWWAERGSIRYVNDEDSLEQVVVSIRDVQDRKSRDL